MSAAKTISYAQSTGFSSSRRRRAMTKPQARKPSAKVTPNVLIEIPRTWTSGFMRSLLAATSAPADSTIIGDGQAALQFRQRRRPAGADADDDVPAGARLRGVRRGAVRPRG